MFKNRSLRLREQFVLGAVKGSVDMTRFVISGETPPAAARSAALLSDNN